MSENNPKDIDLDEPKLGLNADFDRAGELRNKPANKLSRRRFLKIAVGAGLGLAGEELIENTIGQKSLLGRAKDWLFRRKWWQEEMERPSNIDPVTLAGQNEDIKLDLVDPPTLNEIKNIENPLERPMIWGITPNNQDWPITEADIKETERMMGKEASGVNYYQDWEGHGERSNFNKEWMDMIRNHDAVPMVTWMAGDASKWGKKEDPDFQKYALKNIARGDFDEYIRIWANDAKDWKHPFFLRLFHEFNGDDKWWPYPWLIGNNPDTGKRLNEPSDLVAAWRHVHDIFEEVGAKNVMWVWCPDVEGHSDIEQAYPGDEYADWAAMDGYLWGPKKPYKKTFDQIFATRYNQLLKICPQKPFMLAEWGASEEAQDRSDWMAHTLLVDIPYRYRQIRAGYYFNKRKNDEGNSWLVSGEIGKTMAYGLSSKFYRRNGFKDLAAKIR
jgi:hypothetical protein